jgi:hypothetical protein
MILSGFLKSCSTYNSKTTSTEPLGSPIVGILEKSPQDILKLINGGKAFFEGWKDGSIPLENYLEKFMNSGSNEEITITEHMN